MPIKQTIISDITWKELQEDYIQIYKSFWYNSDFDTWILNIFTNQKELEKIFWKKIENQNTEVWECFCCNKNIIEDSIKNIDNHFDKSIKWFIDLLNERSLNIDELEIDLCNECIKKYLKKYIKYE